MKNKKMLAVLLILAVIFGSTSVIDCFEAQAANFADLNGTETVSNLIKVVDETTDVPTPETGGAYVNTYDASGSSGFVAGWVTEGSDTYWKGYRAKTLTSGSDNNMEFRSPLQVTDAFTDGGVLEVVSKMKFHQAGTTSLGGLNCQMYIGDETNSYRMGFYTGDLNFSSGKVSATFTARGYGSLSAATLCSGVEIVEDTWYTFRQLYDFDADTQTLQIIGEDGMVRAAGTVAMGSFVGSSIVKPHVAYGDTFYIKLPSVGDALYVDEFTINKRVKECGDSTDPSNTSFYTLIQPKMDGNTSDASTNMALTHAKFPKGWRYEENDVCWEGRRGTDMGSGSVAFTPPVKETTAFANGGEMIIQNKIRYLAPGAGHNVGNLNFQVYDPNNRIGFSVPNVYVTSGGSDAVFTSRYNNAAIGSMRFKVNEWYTIRQAYNFDTNKHTVLICDARGNELVNSTVGLPAADNHDKVTFNEIYYCTLNTNSDYAIQLDDLVISKTTHKPVTVSYDNTKGEVVYQDKVVEADKEIPVPYNSETVATFTVRAKEGYEVDKILVNGAEVALDNVDFTKVTQEQTMSVTFKQKEKVAPSVTNSYSINTDITMENGSPAALLYSKIQSGYGYTVTESGAVINNQASNLENGMKLVAKNPDNSNVISGMFGIRVFGKGLENITAYMTPYVTYLEQEETKTVYGVEDEFTLTK